MCGLEDQRARNTQNRRKKKGCCNSQQKLWGLMGHGDTEEASQNELSAGHWRPEAEKPVPTV